MLAKDKFVSVHLKNLLLLATEKFKYKTGISPLSLNDILHFMERVYNVRTNDTLETKQYYTVYHGSESPSLLATKL